MGESIVDVPNYGNKMGERAGSDAVLEVSVSFGRFENDTLSWEKWSSFSSNKYLEEVEKCATPGSVAEKKAYFEAHYKKTAARKAELLDQEKQMENDSPRIDYQTSGDLVENTCRTDIKFDTSTSQDSAEVIKQETKLIHEAKSTQSDDPNEDAAVTIECESLSVKEVKEDQDNKFVSALIEETVKANSGEEKTTHSIEPEDIKEISQEMTSSIETPDIKDIPQNLNSMVEITPKPKVINMKLDHRKESHKISTKNKERNLDGVKTKQASLVAKAPKISTPRVSKPAPTSHAISAPRSSTKNVNGPSLLRSKTPSLGQNKRVVPKSLHMSLSLGPASSDSTSLTTTRKSLIMEKMGDKDIVKRAFKTFQNNFNQLKSSVEEKPSIRKQVPAKGAELRFSTPMTPRKENGGPQKAVGPVKRSPKPTQSSFGLNSDEKAGKRKEKLEETSNAKEAQRTHPQSKSKEQKEVDIKKLRHSVNFRATPMPGFYQEQKASKVPSTKEGSKDVLHR